jgi:hypothetical protein
MTNSKIDYHTTNLAILAVRYAMGKSTPAAWQVIEAMKAKWAEIHPNTQAQIVKEIVRDLPCVIIADDVHAEWMGFLEWEKSQTSILFLVQGRFSGFCQLRLALDKSAMERLLESDSMLDIFEAYPPMPAPQAADEKRRWEELWAKYHWAGGWFDLPSEDSWAFRDCARFAGKS